MCSENKGADQLRSYWAADLRLCFRICKKNGFLITRLKWSLNIVDKICKLHRYDLKHYAVTITMLHSFTNDGKITFYCKIVNQMPV